MNLLGSVFHRRANASQFCDGTKSKNSPEKLATPERNSQLGLNCTNSKAPGNSNRSDEDVRRFKVEGQVCSAAPLPMYQQDLFELIGTFNRVRARI